LEAADPVEGGADPDDVVFVEGDDVVPDGAVAGKLRARERNSEVRLFDILVVLLLSLFRYF
jgi:hypothetical protein